MFNTITLYITELTSGRNVIRNIGSCSEFNTGGENARLRFINDWITERGVKQHNSELELTCYKFNNRLHLIN